MKNKKNPKKPYEGIEKILDEKRATSPVHELWANVVLNAMSNVNRKSGHWKKDLQFLRGCGTWELFCEVFDIEPKRASKMALKNIGKITKYYLKHYEG